MKKCRLLPMILALLFLCTGSAFAADAQQQVESQELEFASSSSATLLAELGMDLPFLHENGGQRDIQFVCSSSDCPSHDPFCCGPNQCNDDCYAAACDCLAACAPGDTACEDACAQAEVCCNCDCGSLPQGACSWYGC